MLLHAADFFRCRQRCAIYAMRERHAAMLRFCRMPMPRRVYIIDLTP